MISGETPTAIAMTEPGAGSDLQGVKTTAVADGDDYVINGSKTYITNGQHAELVIVVAKTDPAQGARGTSLILSEADPVGYARGRNLDKIGSIRRTRRSCSSGLRVPRSNLSREGMGFAYLRNQLPQERLSIACSPRPRKRAFDEAVKIHQGAQGVRQGRCSSSRTPVHARDLRHKLQVGWAHLDWAIAATCRRAQAPPRPRPPSCGTPSCSSRCATLAPAARRRAI
jgi:long-chain-acyl-CoA dehydrogenase